MNKKGFVTIFIILGVLIFVIMILVTTFFSDFKKQSLASTVINPDIANVKGYVDNCLYQASVQGISLVLLQGGYYNYSPDLQTYKFNSSQELPYYFLNGKNLIPSLQTISHEAEKASVHYFLECVDNYQPFVNIGYIITPTTPQISIEFSGIKTLVNLKYNLKLVKGTEEIILETFSTEVPFDFALKYEYLNNFLKEQTVKPHSFLMGTLSYLVYQKGDTFNFKQSEPYGEKILVQIIYPQNSRKEPIRFNFILSFDWNKLPERDIFKEKEEQQPNYFEWNITKPGKNQFKIPLTIKSLKITSESNYLKIDKDNIIELDTKDYPNDQYFYYLNVLGEDNQNYIYFLIININANSGSLPIIGQVSPQKAKVSESYYLKMNITNLEKCPCLFTTDSYLFTIDKIKGVINYTPEKENIGKHVINVYVENDYGTTWQPMELQIYE